jgi:alanine-synthesizing transaminase
VQGALPGWLSGRGGIQRQILERVRGNLRRAIASGVEVLKVEAGWSAILRLPQRGGYGEPADRLLQEARIVVHPGSFYGIGEAGRVVVSLLGREGDFREGMEAIERVMGVPH